MSPSVRFAIIFIFLPAILVAQSSTNTQPASLPATKPPVALAQPVTDDYFGTKITDPYRWMERGPEDPQFVDFMKKQNEYTRAVLSRFSSQRAKLLARIQELDNAAPLVRAWQRAGEYTFYLETAPGARTAALMVRTKAGSSRKLLDPESYAEKESHAAIDYYQPSDDGRRVAVGVSLGGSENSTIRIVETSTGKVLPDAITRTQYASPSWRSDGKSFFYSRLQKLDPGAPPTAIYENVRVYLHILGRDADQDPAVFGTGVSPAVNIPKAGFVGVAVVPGSSYLIGYYSAGTTDRVSIYIAHAEKVVDSSAPWKKIVGPEDEVATSDSPLTVYDNEIYLLLDKDAPNRKLVAVNLDAPDVSRARVIVPETDSVMEGVWATADALYVLSRHGVQSELSVLPYSSPGKLQKIELPYIGTVSAVDASVLLPGALFGMESWVKTPAALYYDPKTRKVSDTGLVPRHPADFSQVEAREVEAKSTDGTKVPLSIICRKDIKRDGSHPALYEGYGAYGISLDPAFRPTLLAWIERGGVYAIVHARGGGEYGERWHNAGRKATKQHTIDDMLAAAHYLIDNGYTSPEHLAVRGTSAGGISVGGALTQDPELFAAAIDNVGCTNMLRFQNTQGGAANVPEFGDVNDPDGFRALYAMSAYHHVQDQTKYPAVMGVTGINDPRVPSWIIAEMVARLQTATASDKPVLLRVDFDAGHGLGSSRVQREEQTADEWGFILWQVGDPEFGAGQSGAK
jgi:prolyl oligopeptidase